MYADAAVVQQAQYSEFGSQRIGRSYSSSAASIANARSRYLTGEIQGSTSVSDSIQNRIGALFDQTLPLGVTGILRNTPEIIVTVDGNPTEFYRSIVSIKQPTPKAEDAVAAISFATQIEKIQEELDLSITQIAQLFGVTRKTVYGWLDGTLPRANISNRMELINSLISERGTKLNLKRLKNVWLTAEGGRSFIDILSDESLDQVERLATAVTKLDELAPRLGQGVPKLGKTYLGNAHASDIDRVADLG